MCSLYQLPCGGWDKNIDMAAPSSIRPKNGSREDRGTIDNGGTYTQLRFLARAYEPRATNMSAPPLTKASTTS